MSFMLTVSSCNEDELDIARKGVTPIDDFYKTDIDAKQALATIYAYVWQSTYGQNLGNYPFIKNLLSDDIYCGGLSRNDQPLYESLNEYTFEAENSYILAYFGGYYSLIYRCNLIIDHFTGDNLDTDVKKAAVAQAKVWRAWAYTDLITLWGTPPLVDHALTISEYKQPNGDPEELWNLVVTDLSEAIDSGALEQKTSPTDKITTVTKGYAQALLGKAYVYMTYSLSGGAYGGSQAASAVAASIGSEYWNEAVSVLDEVINSGMYQLYGGPFVNILKEETNWSVENMWEFNRIYNSTTSNNLGTPVEMFMVGWDNGAITGFGDNLPCNRASNFLTPRKEAYDEMIAWQGEANDRLYGSIRTYGQLVSNMGVGVKEGVYSIYANDGLFDMKYYRDENKDCITNHATEKNYPLMRYAEVLLLASEANLMAGKQAKADEYMNQVRRRAGLDDMTGISLSDLQQEKRCELYMEGTRAYDLIRWGLAERMMGEQGKDVPYFTAYTKGAIYDGDGTLISLDSQWEGTVTVNGQDFKLGVEDKTINASGYGWTAGKHELFPFPQGEMLLNGVDIGGNLVQNPGW
jgi:hypothetical protein